VRALLEAIMNSPEKRAREDKRDQKARIKEQRRLERRNSGRSEPEIVSAADIIGNVPSIEEVMESIQTGTQVERSAPPIPVKLFVGSLSDATTSASLRRHFEPHSEVAEAAVITDRNTGASRNFGFVTLRDRKSAAAVISQLHHSELDGGRIVVNIATEKR
jgi:RNA recognition motif-containing protein